MVSPDGVDRSTDGVQTERGLAGLLRTLVAIVLVCSVAVAAVALAPGLVADLEGDVLESDSPPDPDDRDPDRVDPADPGTTSYDTDAERVTSSEVEALIHEAVTDRRADHGLEPLERDATIASVSRSHSADMADRDYFAHENPDGKDPWDRYSDVAGYCGRYGENIARTWVDQPVEGEDGDPERYETAEELAAGIVEQWMNSPPHREAILTESWNRGGVGVYVADDGQVYATHNFCTDR